MSTLAAVLTREPKPPSEVVDSLPRELERIVLRCLRKDPGKRHQHMTDVALLLEELREESESGKLAAAVAPETERRRWPWAVAAVTLVLAAAGAGLWLTWGR